MTATISRADRASTFPSSMRQTSGFQPSPLSRSSDLSTRSVRFQHRSSANRFGLTPTPNAVWNNITAVFRGRNPRVTAVGGNRGIQSAAQVRSMHQPGTWEFSSNGQFRFTPRGLGIIARTDLFPIVGRYSRQGNIIRFSGARSSANLVSINTSSIRGWFSLGTGGARVIQQTSRTAVSGFGAGTFGAGSNSIVSMNLRMVRVS
jgi:hypothetical protein